MARSKKGKKKKKAYLTRETLHMPRKAPWSQKSENNSIMILLLPDAFMLRSILARV